MESSSSDSESETSLRPEDIESDAGQVIEANHHHHHHTNNMEEERLSQGNEIFSTKCLLQDMLSLDVGLIICIPSLSTEDNHNHNYPARVQN